VTRLTFAKDLPSAIKASDTAFIVAPKAFFAKKDQPKLFAPKVKTLMANLAAEAKPGDQGVVVSSLTSAAPKKLILGVLPDRVSRYNCAARPDPIQKVIQSGLNGRDKKIALVVVLDHEAHLIPALNAVGRAFPIFTRRSETQPNPKLQIVVLGPKGEALKISNHVKELIHTSREVAALVDTPPSELDPEAFAARARDLVGDLEGVHVEEIVGEQLKERGLDGIWSVGKAATKAPRMLVATYTPAHSSGKHVALVGKGVTFDTGGLHLKARGMMETMKSDMGGAAAVAGAFRVLVEAKCPHQLSLVMCLAENAIGPTSYKPDDILTLHSGRTVEINNTDAEGRLLLADGVSWAARVLKADTIIDAATLTGAQLIATGMMHAAVISNDEALEILMVAAGQASGDLVHPLPFAPELYKAEFKSPVADMRNSVKNRNNAQTSCAAQFIYNHLEDAGVKWAHVDLAGPSFRNDRGTGYGVALLVEAVGRI
jgi:probable aminopeptidase NPEPL1